VGFLDREDTRARHRKNPKFFSGVLPIQKSHLRGFKRRKKERNNPRTGIALKALLLAMVERRALTKKEENLAGSERSTNAMTPKESSCDDFRLSPQTR
jgi:hypothetical protein